MLKVVAAAKLVKIHQVVKPRCFVVLADKKQLLFALFLFGYIKNNAFQRIQLP